ncbi:MAG: hypothetical protein ACTHN5_02835 [Phycisphaerae bacterium]
MAETARPLQDLPEPEKPGALRRVPASLPAIINAQQLANAGDNAAALRYVPPVVESAEAPAKPAKASRKDNGVLRGIKDLQQLQKQTIAVLESVKANLDEIQQVLRSPEATRGLEKLQNAATLLAKGFARDAVEQADGAVGLLPANPEAHLLLALSLAADQQFDLALHTARKGLALFDRRTHPLAIEAGLLHALAALGCGPEAVERWAVIIDGLPVPVLLEHIGRIAACFPGDAPEGQLDEMLTRRLTREERETHEERTSRRRSRTIETRPGEIPAPALFAGLDAAHYAKLTATHRAILGQVARRLNETKDPGDVVRFLTDCVIPLGNMGLDRSANALGRSAAKRLLRMHADAMTLHRAMTKLEMAGTKSGTLELARLLNHWRRAGVKVDRARRLLAAATVLLVLGVGLFAYVLVGLGALHGSRHSLGIGGVQFDALWVGPALAGIGSVLGVIALLGRTWTVELPEGRPPLTAEELRFIRTPAVRHSLRSTLAPDRK